MKEGTYARAVRIWSQEGGADENMMPEIAAIKLGGLLGYGANCYLIRTDGRYVLIDTGLSSKRDIVKKELVIAV